MRMRVIFRALLALSLIGLLGEATPARAQAPLGEAGDLLAALHDGEGSIAFRYRVEHVDQDGLDETSLASTLRTALRYQTRQFSGLDFFIEMVNVADVGSGPYSVPGDPASLYPVIADPEFTLLNQSFVRFSHEMGSIKGGRQELVYDNARFMGNVGWRQNHQHFDAVRGDLEAGERVDFRYTYIGQAHRITGAVQDLYGHAFNARVDLEEFGHLGAYAYLYDFVDAMDLDTSTFGGFWTGEYAVGESTHIARWRAEFALQQDAFDNPGTIDANYMHFVGGFGRKEGVLSVGFEQLSGDATDGQFDTTFATLHKFNGWADKFLTTPTEGLRDLYISGTSTWNQFGATTTWHKFDAESSDGSYGTEFDAQVSYTTEWEQMIALKAAFYSADDWASDTTKLWAYTTFTF